MAALPDRSVDVVITDPPYEAEAHTAQRMVARAGGRLECEPISFPPITEEQRTESARHMARLARRWILVFCQVEAAMKWRAALEASGAVYKRTCQWIKPDGKPQYSGDRPGIGYESIVACHVPGRSTWNGGGSHGVFIVNKGGELRPKRDAAGVWRYDPADVIRAAATRGVRNLRTAGDVAAEAFRMFDQGGELKDIVSALRITPAEVRHLYKEWQSQLDDPPPTPETSGPGLLDEDPRAEEAFLRAMAQASGIAFPPTRQPKK
jgi:hypothetical protein